MVGTNFNLSTITINVKGLKSPGKRERFLDKIF